MENESIGESSGEVYFDVGGEDDDNHHPAAESNHRREAEEESTSSMDGQRNDDDNDSYDSDQEDFFMDVNIFDNSGSSEEEDDIVRSTGFTRRTNTNTLPAARQHTYLPGTTNPLYPEQWLQSPASTLSAIDINIPTRSKTVTDVDAAATIILPILQLRGVVLFPNSTLPLRFTHSSWVQYLTRQIAFARDGGIVFGNANNNETLGLNNSCRHDQNNSQVRIGIVTKLNSVRRRRRRIQFGGGNNNDRDDTTTNPNDGANRNTNTNDDNNGETNNNDERGNSTSADTGNVRSQRMGRWNIQMIRRGFLNHGNNRSDSSSSDDDGGNGDSDNENQRGGRRSRRDERFLHPIEPPSSSTEVDDPLINRIGTLATITYTHEDDNRPTENGRQIIVTALSTGRFRIVKSVSQHNDANVIDPDECKLYHIQEILDDPITVPYQISKKSSKPFSDNNNNNMNIENRNVESKEEEGSSSSSPSSPTNVYYHHQYKRMRYLSIVSPIPTLVYQRVWPWKLAEDIVREIESNDALDGLLSSLPPSSGRYKSRKNNNCHESTDEYMINRSHCDPVPFSFWLAANLPLSIMNKLDVLEMNHIERLRYLLEKIIKQRNKVKYIKCKHCGSKIAKISSLFTIAGAEGTSGAYVNEHGCIHQTITVKDIKIGSVLYYGGEETRDSWFPGYSWTIACCSTCSRHLGWKFKLVCRERDERWRNIFWGLSGSSVTTEKTSPRRIVGRNPNFSIMV